MRTPPTAPLLALVLVICAFLVGCTPTADSDSPTGTGETTPTPSRTEGQTLWTIAGTEQQLPDDDPDVQAVRTLVTVHSGVVDNRAPETIEASLEKEFNFYTPEFAAALENVGWRTITLKRANSSAAILEQHGIAWMQSTINAKRITANVRYESYVVFTSGTEAFLQDNGLTLGTEYVMVREVTATVHDGEWLISDVRESGLQPRSIP